MADEEQRARIGGEHLLEEVEGLEVEVVGRLVEDEEVGRAGERAGEHQPSALAAGERLHRRPRLLGAEEEVLHVADDVARLAADDDRIAASVGQRVGDGRLRDRGSRGAGRAWRRARLVPSRTVP